MDVREIFKDVKKYLVGFEIIVNKKNLVVLIFQMENVLEQFNLFMIIN